MNVMNIRDIGEFGLIERFTEKIINAGVGQSPSGVFPLIIGMGDDTAAWNTTGVKELSTTDTVVQGVHFTLRTIPWKDLGWKVMAGNLSDIASMGGIPLYALVTLGLPEETNVLDVDALYEGIIWACQTYDVTIVGGDIVRSPTCFVSVTLTGYVTEEPMRRVSAQKGDLIAVTGQLGASRGGLDLLLDNKAINKEALEYLVDAHRHPKPRVREGRILAREGVTAAMDISDGLVDDLKKFMKASDLAAQLDVWRIPINPLMVAAFDADALGLALAGGEDYELLYAGPQQVIEKTLALLPDAAVIGRVVSGDSGVVTLLQSEDHEMKIQNYGWDHFR